MAGMITLVRIIETRPPEVTIRRWRAIRHGTFRLIGTHWHQHMLPEHFKANADRVYHFRQRSREYLKAKAWRLARGRNITHQDVVDEMERTISRREQNRRGFGEDWYWREFQKTRERMLDEAGAPLQDLVLTGTLRANVTQIATIRTFESRFKLVMPGTAYTPARPRTSRQPPLADETTRLLQREKEVLSQIGKAYAVEQLKTATPQTTVIQ